MSQNPLFPNDDDPADESAGYVLPKNERTIQPLEGSGERDAAANVIRQKLDKLYTAEPDAMQEIAEAEIVRPRSKHEQFMHELSQSGKSLADIQTEWHVYYAALPDHEKHEVWQEFYDSSAKTSQYFVQAPQQLQTAALPLPTPTPATEAPQPTVVTTPAVPLQLERRSRATIKKKIVNTVSANGTLKAKHHLQSLLFGLSTGSLVLFIFLFGFFNEVLIAPFIQPSRHVSATPLILNTDGVAPTPNPEVIIPKINVELPVDFTQTSTNEATIENALESGVVHYPTTVMPGQDGNTAFFGHSSNNIFNKGKYKFAFVLLHELVPGDTFYITDHSKVYVYKVITKDIVDPSDVAVLGPVAGQTATATLITCDPPGTSLHRLIIVGQQVSPDPSTNGAAPAAAATPVAAAPTTLPGNGPTLFSRLWHDVF